MSARIDPAGIPFVAGVLALATAAAFAVDWWAAVPFLAFAILFLAFFRDPDRQASAGEKAVLAPADGRVLVAGMVW